MITALFEVTSTHAINFSINSNGAQISSYDSIPSTNKRYYSKIELHAAQIKA